MGPGACAGHHCNKCTRDQWPVCRRNRTTAPLQAGGCGPTRTPRPARISGVSSFDDSEGYDTLAPPRHPHLPSQLEQATRAGSCRSTSLPPGRSRSCWQAGTRAVRTSCWPRGRCALRCDRPQTLALLAACVRAPQARRTEGATAKHASHRTQSGRVASLGAEQKGSWWRR